MALAAVQITVGQSLGNGHFATTIKGAAIPPLSTVIANKDTLVADGASPTQGHVNTLSTNLAALNAALAGHVVVIWDGAVITSRPQLRVAIKAALEAVEAGYGGLAA